jgi:RNA-directed DNA polymerase
MLERAKEVTRSGQYVYIEYARFADDLVVLIDAYPRHRWLLTTVSKRLREEFGKLQVEVNEEKSRTVDLACGESFRFLGFDFRSVLSLKKVRRANYAPKLKKRTVLLRKIKEIFRRFQSQPIDERGGTDKQNLTLPRHISTLPDSDFHFSKAIKIVIVRHHYC